MVKYHKNCQKLSLKDGEMGFMNSVILDVYGREHHSVKYGLRSLLRYHKGEGKK
jgi:hypothetical protein